jgi:integrase
MAAAVDAGYLAQSPCHNVPLPKVEREEMRFLTPTEIVTLAETIRPAYRALVFVGAYGGLRIGELAGLRRSRVDLLRGTVSVAEILTEVAGRLHFGPPKTRASRRTVSLPRVVTRELDAHLAGGGDPDDHVFTAPQGGTLRIVAFRNRIWRPATEAAGLTGLRIHDLRHTAVALWIAAGASPKEVAGRAHLGQLHPRPLRPSLPRGGYQASRPARYPARLRPAARRRRRRPPGTGRAVPARRGHAVIAGQLHSRFVTGMPA